MGSVSPAEVPSKSLLALRSEAAIQRLYIFFIFLSSCFQLEGNPQGMVRNILISHRAGGAWNQAKCEKCLCFKRHRFVTALNKDVEGKKLKEREAEGLPWRECFLPALCPHPLCQRGDSSVWTVSSPESDRAAE